MAAGTTMSRKTGSTVPPCRSLMPWVQPSVLTALHWRGEAHDGRACHRH